ncbi:MAG: hypothetical protein ABR591_03410 [Candidatus Velthaea sp.]
MATMYHSHASAPRRLAAAVLAAFLLAPAAALAALAPGTQVTGTLNQSINTGDAQVGQPFTLTNVSSSDGSISGATVRGHVADVQSASRGRKASITLAPDSLRTAGGTMYALSGRVMSMQAQTKNNTVNEVAGGVAGMVVGNIVGKTIGTNVGGLLGAAGGVLYAKNIKQNITVPQNSQITFQVTAARTQQRGR